MLNVGFTQQEMSNFFATNFKGAGFTFNDNKFVSNIGHDSKAEKLFKTVIDESASSYDKIIFSGGKIGYQIETTLSELKKAVPFILGDISE